ncbi:MAG: cupin domain-containing protein [Cyclobacteriaceae bacterium]|nr:cupin domain-containing protein [Cyclobacteriaceae bacterium]
MIVNTIAKKEFDGLKVEKIFKSPTCETILVRLQKSHTFPKHTTPKEALIVIHQGEVVFNIKGESSTLVTGDTYEIPINEEHSVVATTDAIFLIIR